MRVGTASKIINYILFNDNYFKTRIFLRLFFDFPVNVLDQIRTVRRNQPSSFISNSNYYSLEYIPSEKRGKLSRRRVSSAIFIGDFALLTRGKKLKTASRYTGGRDETGRFVDSPVIAVHDDDDELFFSFPNCILRKARRLIARGATAPRRPTRAALTARRSRTRRSYIINSVAVSRFYIRLHSSDFV